MSTTARLGIASAVLFLLSTLARAGNGLVRDGRVLTEYRPPVIESPDAALLVVTLLDGRVVAVRMDSGEVMWTYDTGTPLVTAKQAKAMVPDLRIFPGVDGRLYLYGSALATADGSTSGTKLERLPISLPELVAASPSVTHDGSLITGARSTEVLLLDRLTGKRLGGGAAAAGAGVGSGVGGAGAGPGGVGAAAAAEAGEAAGAAPGPGLGADAGVGVGSPATIGLEDRALLPLPDPDRVVVLGREDFVVRSIKSGAELWNVSFSRLVNMQPQGAAAAAAAAAAAGAAEQAAAETLGSLGQGGSRLGRDALPYFTVRADHTLQAYDPTSRIRRWALSFDAAPVGVFATRLGDTNFLDPEVRAAQRLHLHLHQQEQQQQPSPHAGGRQPQQQQVPGDGKGGKQGPGQCPDWSVGGLAALVRRQGNSGGNAGAGGGAEGGTCSPAGSDGSGSGGRGGSSGSSSQVLVGRLRGSLYALPADHVTLEEGGVQANSLALSGPASTTPLDLPQLPPSTSPASAAASAATTADKALAVIDSSSGGGGSSRTDVMTYMADVETGEGVVSGLVCPPGVHLLATLDEPKEPRGPWPWLPNAVQTSPAPQALGEGSSAQWPRLPAAAGAGAGGGRGAAADGAWWATVVVAGLAGAVVVIVVVSLRGRGKAAAAAAEMAAAKAPGATGAAAGGAGGGGQQLDVDVDAVTGGSSGSTSSVGKGRTAGGGGQQRRRKGRNTTGSAANGSGGVNGSAAAAAAAAPAPSPSSRGEEEQRRGSSSGEPLPRLSAAPAPTSDAAAQLLPSAEPRVQVRPDGSVAIGRLLVGPGILGYGSAGTVVYEGKLDGRPVAVKRLLRQFTALARKEIEVLILSDEHPNVVRCFAMEEDREFVYLALERCRSTLADFLTSPDGREQFVEAASGQPTQRCLSAMLDVCRGLAALHERGIVHRDLKPQNVLLTESSQRAKLSDMGLSKLLVPEQSSFVLYDNSHMGGYGSGAGGGGAGSSSSGGPSCGPGGSSGWQAPEQLIARGGGEARQTRSMDVFSLGCVLYYCMTGGRHPFGDSHYERDANILHGAPRLGPLAAAAGPEAAHLVGACLGKEAGRRPVLPEVLGHPLWWSDERRMAFLVDISDRIEFEDREPDTSLLEALEGFARVALAGPGLLPGEAEAPGAPCPSTSTSFGAPATAATSSSTSAPPSSLPSSSSSSPPNWGAALPAELVANLGRYRRYEYTSLRDLLRVVRNKRNHFREMPQQLQALMGPLPGGFLRFFTARFPRLLLSVYVFALRHLAVAGGGGEQQLAQYWPHAGGGQQQTGSSSGSGGQAFVQVYMAQYGPCLRTPKAPQPQQQPPAASQAVPEAVAGEEESPSGLGRVASSVTAAPSSSAGMAAGGMSNGAAATYLQTATPLLPPSAASLPPASGLQTLTPPFPNAGLLPPTLPLHPHPPAPPPPAQPATPAPAPLVLVGYEPCGEDGECHIREFPRRPGKQHCDFYVKTGHCKFGETCVFDHPLEFAVRLSSLGLPLRPSEPLCSFYLKNNDCRFGPACKFHHPMLRPVFAGSAAAASGAAGVVGIAGSEAGAVAQI
ncbi:hypothetical protein Agub_g5168 [Astrephomene gubernaculifera]|uniref:non-specific serine/threonine protein kinase n=1 Tax=Astrephomene gubernaculifera TaxID=47775 RepID=A0AAD3HKH6_9CHLO|nr:hypothetical protein Agub_g5168 [Astrephomene gubernaculifera]